MHFSHPWNLMLLALPALLLIIEVLAKLIAPNGLAPLAREIFLVKPLFLRKSPSPTTQVRGESARTSIAFSSLSAVRFAGKSLRHRLLPLPGLLVILSSILVIIAIAGPQHGTEAVSGKRSGIAIEMLFDISSSMDITLDSADTDFDRITAAKKVCNDFIIGNNDDLRGRQNDIVGLITFARYADTACPMTTCLPALTTIVDELEVENRPNEDGTAFGDALILAAAHLMKVDENTKSGRHSNIKSKIIILLTDGDNNCGKHLPNQAAALAQQWGIKIYAIFLGDRPANSIGKLPQPTESQKQLIKVCERTGGICRMVYDYDSLRAVYTEIDSLEKSRINLFTDIVYRELFPWFTLVAAFCMALSIILNATLLRRTP